MKSRQHPYLYILLILILISLSGCTAASNKTAPMVNGEKEFSAFSAIESEAAKVITIQEKIARAIKEAKRTRKTSVDIYLDELSDIVQPGDIANINCIVTLENGTVLSGQGKDVQKYLPGKTNQAIIAGTDSKVPGLAQAVIGMGINQKKTVTIEAKNAFGRYSAGKRQRFPSVRRMPVMIKFSKKAYGEKFKSLPFLRELVQITPYFDSEIIDITLDDILIKNLARDKYIEQAPFGKIIVSNNGKMITITLQPIIGAFFTADNKKGIILSAGPNYFVVDFNHPFSGKALKLDIEVASITKASLLKNLKIDWIDDHDIGFDMAFAEKKNKVLVLYAGWCQWCEKLFKETFNDPRIKLLSDRFVWVKANSDEDRSLKALYRQDGFPMIVLTNYKGRIIKKMEGFRDADSLLAELEQLMDLKMDEVAN